MEVRVSKLENLSEDTRVRLTRMEAKLDTVATKESVEQIRGELYRALNEQTWKLVGAATLLVGATAFLVKVL